MLIVLQMPDLHHYRKQPCMAVTRLVGSLCRIEEMSFNFRIVYDKNEYINLNWQSYDKETALHKVNAARNKAIMKSKKIWPFKRCSDCHTKKVKHVLRMGANVNLQNYYGETPLHIAARHEMDYIVKLLLHCNADIHCKLDCYGFDQTQFIGSFEKAYQTE